MYRNQIQPKVKVSNKTHAVVGILAFVLLVVLYRFNLPVSVSEGFNHVEMSISSVGHISLFYLNAIFGIFGLLMISECIQSIYVEKFGRMTLTCLCTHSIVISVVRYACNRILPEPVAFVTYIIAFGLVIVSTVICHHIFAYWIPNLLGRNPIGSEMKANIS